VIFAYSALRSLNPRPMIVHGSISQILTVISAGSMKPARAISNG
jgi:hypothetical protein